MSRFFTVKGFTLIEMMIVVALVAIVAMIAYPSYQSNVEKARRTEARAALTEIAALQEKFFFRDNRYSSSLMTVFGATNTRDGYYNLTMDITAAGTGCVADGQCYQLTATAAGAQTKDTACQILTLSSTGLRAAFSGNATDTTALCW